MKCEEDIYKAFGLSNEIIEKVGSSKETTQKQLDIFLDKVKNISSVVIKTDIK